MANIFTDASIAEFLAGQQNNPAYQQAQIQLANQPLINAAAFNAYNQQLGGALPQQQVAGINPTRMTGFNTLLGSTGALQNLAGMGAGTLGSVAAGAPTGTNTLQNLATGAIQPQFNAGVASDYYNSIAPNMLSAQQALANQSNLAWNKGVGNIGGLGGGFMSSGRNAALGQAAENAATNLGSQQQMLAYNAAQQAAQAGQQAGAQGYAGRYGAGSTLAQQGLIGANLTGAMQQAQMLPGLAQTQVGEQLQNQEQAQMNAQFNNQLAAFQNPFRSLQNLQAGLGTLGSTTGALNVTMPNNTMMLLNLLGQYAGNSGTFGPLLNMIGSGLSDYFKGLNQ